MLSDTLVVGHAFGGVLEMITDGENGFLFQESNSLTDVLRRGILNYADASMKQKARERINLMCGPANSDRLEEMLNRAAKLRPHPCMDSNV